VLALSETNNLTTPRLGDNRIWKPQNRVCLLCTWTQTGFGPWRGRAWLGLGSDASAPFSAHFAYRTLGPGRAVRQEAPPNPFCQQLLGRPGARVSSVWSANRGQVKAFSSCSDWRPRLPMVSSLLVLAEDEQERLLAQRAGGNLDHELAWQGLDGCDDEPSTSLLDSRFTTRPGRRLALVEAHMSRAHP
jgi:hypothetical protein